MSAGLVLLAIQDERVWAAPPGRRDQAIPAGRVVWAWRAWDAFDPAGAWLGAFASRYAAAHALVDHAAVERARAALAAASRRWGEVASFPNRAGGAA